MKGIFIAFLALWVSALGIFYACKKEMKPHLPVPPVANAGRDTTIVLASCDTTALVILDGSGSTDASNKIVSYSWIAIDSPKLYFSGYFAPKVRINLPEGVYSFQLTVTDSLGLSSKDTVLISVVPPKPSAYNLDIDLNGAFNFTDNYGNCPPICYYQHCNCALYFDSTNAVGTGSFTPIGKFAFYVDETADTALNSDNHTTSFGLYSAGDKESLYGVLSVNFKKLIENGGGAFTGLLSIYKGSAQGCNASIFSGLDPLTATGTITITGKNGDYVTGTVSMNLKGQTYF
jgi:hypothetical protein